MQDSNAARGLWEDSPSHVAIDGGKHNIMGPTVAAKLVRYGFYPQGGGRIEVDINPAPPKRINCIERGKLPSVTGTAYIAGLTSRISTSSICANRRRVVHDRKAVPTCVDQLDIIEDSTGRKTIFDQQDGGEFLERA